MATSLDGVHALTTSENHLLLVSNAWGDEGKSDLTVLLLLVMVLVLDVMDEKTLTRNCLWLIA